MAASVGSGADRVEPNLTPLLDVILQLIMFFMITVNFVNNTFSANVRLASSISATELQDKAESDMLVVNVEVEREKAGFDTKGQQILKVTNPKVTKIRIQTYGKSLITVWEWPNLSGQNKKQPLFLVEFKEGADADAGNKKLKINDQAISLHDWINTRKALQKVDEEKYLKALQDGVKPPGRPVPVPDNADNEYAAITAAQEAIHKVASDYRLGRANKDKSSSTDRLPFPVLIRPDLATDYPPVIKLITQCNQEKFSSIDLRSLIKN
jgi:biopolymer transport protein ExbD